MKEVPDLFDWKAEVRRLLNNDDSYGAMRVIIVVCGSAGSMARLREFPEFDRLLARAAQRRTNS